MRLQAVTGMEEDVGKGHGVLTFLRTHDSRFVTSDYFPIFLRAREHAHPPLATGVFSLVMAF